jgi:hypothetical protein
VALITMPDIDTGQRGTGVVHVILRVIQTPTPAETICSGNVRRMELNVRMPFN